MSYGSIRHKILNLYLTCKMVLKDSKFSRTYYIQIWKLRDLLDTKLKV